MEISPSDLGLPAGADDEEAAAIIAAVNAMLAAEAPADAESLPDRIHAPWRFQGRLLNLEDRSVRIPRTAPPEEWRAAGRIDRF